MPDTVVLILARLPVYDVVHFSRTSYGIIVPLIIQKSNRGKKQSKITVVLPIFLYYN
jgi:hypothetical protein